MLGEAIVIYIDPGTGSMLFTILIGIIGFLLYILKIFWIKIKFIMTRGKVEQNHREKIPILIFAEDKRYWQMFKPICDEFEKRGIDIVYWTMSPDDPVLNLNYDHIRFEFIGEGNKAYAKLNIVNACIVLATTPGLDIYQWQRSKFADYYVHMFHSVGYGGYRLFGIDFYDAVIAAGQYQIDALRELEGKRHLPAKDTVLAGMPYFDELKNKLDRSEHVSNSRPVVLLAPSWGESSILNKIGPSIIEELIKTDCDLIIRPHPQSFISDHALMTELMEKYPDNEQLTWDRSSDNFETLRKADIMISDFSGVIYDYSLVFDKPVIYMDSGDMDVNCKDYYCLDQKSRWVFNSLSSIGTSIDKNDVANIGNIIQECLRSKQLTEGRDIKRKESWAYPGEGASRTVDYIIRKYEQLNMEKTSLIPDQINESCC